MNTNNTAILLAGIFCKNTLLMVEMYIDIFNEIIISTYDDSSIFLTKCQEKFKNNKSLKIIINKMPDISDKHNSQNIYYQCFSVSEGLKKISCKYVIKLRTDEFYSSLSQIVKKLPRDKVSTANIFVRDIHYKHFHLSDHIIIGETSILFPSFNNLKSYIDFCHIKKVDKLNILNTRIPAEVKITLFILFELEKITFLNWNNLSKKDVYSLLLKNFYVLNVYSLYPYSIKASAVGEITNYQKFVKKDTKLVLRYITNIEDLKPRNYFLRFLDKLKYKLKKMINN